jgi:pSer/pThr/pTyr-binding forkhead associated (FHA) protein
MEISELNELANKLSADEFAARFPHLFLLYYETVDPVGASSFATQLVSRDAARKKPTSELRVVKLIKAPTNPYSDRISVGRARNCDVVLRNPSVSKLHAHIRREPNGSWVVIDLNSHNGTVVDGMRVSGSQPVPIKVGEQVTFGGMTVRIVDAHQLYLVLLGRSPWGNK